MSPDESISASSSCLPDALAALKSTARTVLAERQAREAAQKAQRDAEAARKTRQHWLALLDVLEASVPEWQHLHPYLQRYPAEFNWCSCGTVAWFVLPGHRPIGLSAYWDAVLGWRVPFGGRWCVQMEAESVIAGSLGEALCMAEIGETKGEQ